MMKFSQKLRHLAYPSLRMLALVWAANSKYAILSLFVTIIGACVTPGQIWVTKIIIDRVVGFIADPDVTSLPWSMVVLPMAGMALLSIVGVVCESVTTHLRTLLGMQTRSYTEYLIYRQASRLDMAFYETSSFYDRLTNALRETNRAHNFAYRGLEVVGLVVSTIGVACLLWHLHPIAVFVLFIGTAPEAIALVSHTQKYYHRVTGRASDHRMAKYLSDLLASRDAAKELKLYSLGEILLQRFRRCKEIFIEDARFHHFWTGKLKSYFGIVSTIGTALIWIYAIIQAVTARLTIGDVTLAFQSVQQGRLAFRNLFQSISMFYEDTLYATNLFSFLELEPHSVEGALVSSFSTIQVPQRLSKGIEFRNVSFRYPLTERYVLRDLSFHLPIRTKVAFVGPNGAGKTTLVKLIARLYDPTEGVILVDGRDLREYDVEQWRSVMGITFQDFIKYDLTMRENIQFGRVGHPSDTAGIESAAKKAGLIPIIKRLPKGYDTILGRIFDNSVDLSGGEWQKVALSRAFIRHDSQILILDEPNSALDPLSEFEIYSSFAELTAGKMSIFISHRFSTVRMADLIVVLDDGCVLEKGTHDELLLQNGKYAEMFNVQAERYR